MSEALFAPLSGTGDQAFDQPQAAHLLRRAGFAGSPEDVRRAVDDGLEATVDRLFEEDQTQEDEYRRLFDSIAGTLMNFDSLEGLQAWWIYRMQTTRTPLGEKLALFWHGHFATSMHKVDDSRLMHKQLLLLRERACGSFRELLLAIATDPAMLVWLDGQSNTKEHPNENFARELLELFTCGIGHYSERDVREAARALTGWQVDDTEAVLQPDSQDTGTKQFLGYHGKFSTADIVDLLLQYPPTAHFLARKLLRFFALPEPDKKTVEAGAALLTRSQFNIKWFLRELFLSKFFYSKACVRRRVASPVEYVVGTLRLLGAHLPAIDLGGLLTNMGQSLLAPPSVKGWDGEQAWINAGSLAARQEFVRILAEDTGTNRLGYFWESPADTEGLRPEEVVDRLAATLMQGDLSSEVRDELAKFLVAADDGLLEAFRDDPDFRDRKIREAVATIVALPEYQAW